MKAEFLASADMLPRVSMAHDLQQTAYWPLLVANQSAEQDSSAELSVLDSESQPACDLTEPLQLDDFAMLYVERVSVLTNHY
jgi:hypothetical protein